MATVYLARDLRHERRVALKVVREELAATLGRERFLHEIRTTARLQHPHILPLLDSGETDGRLFYVMPFVDGETLRARLNRERSLSLVEVVQLVNQVAGALESAHRTGIIHRDIKPENILLKDGLPLLADFGIAVALEHAGSTRLTSTGTSIGTPDYMSPEQALGEHLDPRSDQYSLACVVFETIAGHPPFRANTSFATISAHVNEPPPLVTSARGSVSSAIATAIQKALAKKPIDRFASVTEFAAALTSANETSTREAQRPRTQEQKAIAVLPFDSLSPDPADAYLAEGLTEEITADLARLRALRVTARNSAVAAKARTRDVREIARLLNTRYVLEGSVRRAGSALRITAQLIDGETDAHLWSEKYNGTMDDVFAMQEGISRTIVDALALQLSAEERRDLEAHPIDDLLTYQLYLRVRHCFKHTSKESLAQARELLERAIARSGDNHLLLGAFGVLEVYEYSLGLDATDTALRRADEYATRALALNPTSAEGLYAKAIVAEKTSLARSVAYLEKSVTAEPMSDAMAGLAFGLAIRGEEAKAAEYARRAVQIDPLSPLVMSWSALAAWYSNLAPQAIARMDAALTVVPPNGFTAWMGAYLMAITGNTDRAFELSELGAKSDEGLVPTFCALLTAALRHHSMPAMSAANRRVLRGDPHGSQILAELYAAGGAHADAYEWLRNAIAAGVCNVRYMTTQSPFLAVLRGEAEFDALMMQARAHASEVSLRRS